MKRKDAHFDAEILHTSKEAGSNIVATSVKVGFASIFHVKMRWIVPFDKKILHNILLLSTNPPLKYYKNPP